MIEVFDVVRFRAALDSRDPERIHQWIEVDPLAAREELQRVGDYAKGHGARRAAGLQELRAASFSGTLDRGSFELALADYKAWKRGNDGFVRIIGRFIQHAQQVHAAQKRGRNEVLQAAQEVRFGARVAELEARVAELEALVADLVRR